MFKIGLTWLQRLIAWGTFVAGVACLFLLVSSWQQQYWIRSQRIMFEELPADRMLDAVRRLAAQGPDVLPELASAMASMRASVAMAAQQVLLEELEKLEAQQDRKSARARVYLAESLARHVREFGPTTLGFSANLAERLLRDDQERLSSDERARLVDACGIVLNFSRHEFDAAQLARTVDLNWHETPPPIPWEATLALLREKELEHSQRLAAKLPGGGLDPDGVEVPALPESAQELITAPQSENSAVSVEVSPKPLPEVSGSTANQQYERPEKFRKPFELRRMPKAGGNANNSPSHTEANQDANSPKVLSPSESTIRQALPSNSNRSRSGGPPRDETMVRLLQALVAADQQAANQAATALTERGLPEEHLELAKRLAAPDPAVRKSLVEILPRTPGLDARPWLMWLAHDDHPDVRFAAMSMLATSQDPRLCEQVEQLARSDYDERIVALADHLLQRRTGSR